MRAGSFIVWMLPYIVAQYRLPKVWSLFWILRFFNDLALHKSLTGGCQAVKRIEEDVYRQLGHSRV
ncbi:hypothetical protein ET33_08225 [Paenibacillus tyrfis]|uniref:Uncharacterized protein n=1 Tax=Paenibacillus tyrfis TaxID=1501230 RepID=A0A081P1Y0_9BACL|nr:hypothetical protein ET33_08225 [Paenibacillus tyrfis]